MCKTSNVDDYVRSFCWLNRSSPLIRNSGRDFWKLAAGVYIYICISTDCLWRLRNSPFPLCIQLELFGKPGNWWNGSHFGQRGPMIQQNPTFKPKAVKNNGSFMVSFFQFMDFWQPTIFRSISWYVSREFHSELFWMIFLLGKNHFFSTEIWIRSIFFISSRDGDSRWVSMCKSPTSNTTTQCGHWVFGGFLLERWRCGVWHVTLEEKSFNKEN